MAVFAPDAEGVVWWPAGIDTSICKAGECRVKEAGVEHSQCVRKSRRIEYGRPASRRRGPEWPRSHVHLSYNPPAGAVGHAAASLLGWDAKTQMEQSFLRVKTYLETGKVPRDVEAAIAT